MTNTSNSGDRLVQIEVLLQQSVIASNERMTRLEQSLAETDNQLKQSIAASDKRLTRIEQLVESNNRFLEGFSDRINRYTARMDNLANKLDNFSTRIDGVIFTTNQDRQEANLRLAGIQRQLQTVESKIDEILEQRDG